MTDDLQRMLESKRKLRRALAARPVAEKLRMLDALREREVAIRSGMDRPGSNAVREAGGSYRDKSA